VRNKVRMITTSGKERMDLCTESCKPTCV